MNNSCNIPIDPLLDIAANGKRCRGILYKYLRELLTVRLSFTRKQLRPQYRWQPVATVSTKAKRIVVGSSWNACPFETCAVRIVCVPGDTIRGPCRVHQSRNIDAKKKKLERRVGKKREKGYNDGVNEGWRGITEARETLVDRRNGWRGREWGSGREREGENGLRARNQPWRPGAHNLPIGTLHYSCLQLQAANQPGPPVICLGQIQSQPCGGFELTINFKRVRRPFRQRSAQSIHQRGQATMFRRVSDRRCAKGINLLPAESGEAGIGGRIFMRGKRDEWKLAPSWKKNANLKTRSL